MPVDDDARSIEEKRAGGAGAAGDAKAERQRRAAEAAEQRRARAAEKLRENLLRRKAQVRARRKGEPETGTGLPASRDAEDPDTAD